ncbi:MAG: TatD family hydrolase [Candidatus Thermoplasmatota archaeon]
MCELIDTHAHLELITQIENCLKEAKDRDVSAIIAVGSSYQSNIEVLKIAGSYKSKDFPKIFPALGLHPWDLKEEVEVGLEHIKSNIDKIVAIGEIGLDYWLKEVRKDENKKELQRKIFKKQLELAENFKKPVTVHSRGAWKDCYEFVKNFNLKEVIFHWYSGPLEILEGILEKGYFVSATPALEYSKEHQEVIKRAPIENILLESDAPVKYRGKESKPSDVARVLELVAELKNLSKEEVASKTTDNAKRIFGLK